MFTPVGLIINQYEPCPIHSSIIFARDSIYAIARICYRNSVWTDVWTSVTLVDQSKTVEAMDHETYTTR